jgi:hypothetical protein
MADAAPADDALSPTTIVLNALRKAGVPITPDNIRRYVAGSMRQGNEVGTDIQGLRIENPGESAGSATRGAVARGERSGGRSTLPADLTHGPTNEADWQPNTTKTTSASPAASDVQRMQQATLPAMRGGVPDVALRDLPPDIVQPPYNQRTGPAIEAQMPNWQDQFKGRSMDVNPDALPGPRNASLAYQQPSSLEQAMIEALSGPQPQGMLPPPPRQITGPPSAPEAPMASPNTPIPMPGEPAPPQAPPGLQVENVPMPSPQQTIQAPPASSIPPSGGLSIEDRMMPGRGNLTIQAPSASSMPPTQAPVIQETRPILDKIIRGGVGGAGVGRLAGAPGAIIGGIAGAAPGLWDLGRHIVGR